MGTVHSACTSGKFSYGDQVNLQIFDVEYPVVYFDLSVNGTLTELDYKFYIETFHVPMIVKEGSYKAGTTYKI